MTFWTVPTEIYLLQYNSFNLSICVVSPAASPLNDSRLCCEISPKASKASRISFVCSDAVVPYSSVVSVIASLTFWRPEIE